MGKSDRLSELAFRRSQGRIWRGLICVLAGCSSPPALAASADSGASTGAFDASSVDASLVDASIVDASIVDAGVVDARPADAATASQEERLLYLADQDTDGVLELFLSVTNGAQTTSYRINSPLPSPTEFTRRVRDFGVNHDGSMVLYTAQSAGNTDAPELFAVSIDGVDIAGTPPGSPDRLHGNLPVIVGTPTHGVNRAEWVPGKNEIVFGAVLEAQNEGALYRVVLGPTGWGSPEKLSGALFPGSPIRDFAIAPDGNSVLYRAAHETANVEELHWVDLSGAVPASPVRVSSPFPPGDRDVAPHEVGNFGYDWAPDASKFYYVSDELTNNTNEIFLVDLMAGVPQTPVHVNAAITWEGVTHARWSENSKWLAFVAREQGTNGAALMVLDTETTPLGTGEVVSGGLYATGSAVGSPPLWAPDSRGLAFHATELESGGQTTELFFVDASGIAPEAAVRVNGPLTNGGTVPAGGSRHQTMVWAPDSTFIVYASEEEIEHTIELFLAHMAPIGVAPSINISGAPTFVANDVTPSLTPVSPDSSTVLFRSNKTIGVHDLFGVDVSTTPPGAATKVNGQLTLGGNVNFAGVDDKTFQWSGSGEMIAYMADGEQSDVVEIFVVLASHFGTAVRGSAALVPGGNVSKFEWVR